MNTNTNDSFSLTENTNRVCSCAAFAIFLIVLFILSPLSNYFLTSVFMKIVTLLLLGYTIYLNVQQTDYLSKASASNKKEELRQQFTINIICSYTFTLFIGLLFLFVVKSFF